MGMLDGALRIMPSWELTGFGHTVPLEVFLPAVLFPGLLVTFWLLYPGLERRITGDNELHNLLDRPRNRPKRTAAGVAMFAFMFTLFAASSTDVLANFFHVSLNATLWFFRIATFVIPVIAAFVTYQLCNEMQGVHGVGKRKRAVIVTRSSRGGLRHGAHGPSARRRARGVGSRAGARVHRHLAPRQQRRRPPREFAHGCAPGHALIGPAAVPCGSRPNRSTPSPTSPRAAAPRCVTPA